MADFIEIKGGIPLQGDVTVGGAKNAALPMLLASLLSGETCEYDNVPNLEDINLTLSLLEHFGGQVEYTGHKVKVSVPTLVATEASYSLVKALRASFWVLGPLLARGGAARVALPGGDIIGARPVDLHIAALEQMGADIKVKHGVVFATAAQGLRPATIKLRFPSVGATHQIVMAASLTRGTTTIDGAACEPEVVAVADLIRAMGGDIEGAGTPHIVIQGKESLGGAKVKIIGDRIEAGTYLLSAAATNGKVTARGINPAYFGKFLDVLDEMGLSVHTDADSVTVSRGGADIRPVRVSTNPFPEVATDLQAPLMAALCLASGESVIEENIFEGRFGHVSELCRMGASITVDGRTAKIHGVQRLTGAPVEGFDIRAAAALVVAGLAAEGVTTIYEPQHLRRGYEALEAKFAKLGAKIGVKIADPEDYAFTGC
jgi:UDP-N-acetylglucosamine 1-carboxyvinyltransferase